MNLSDTQYLFPATADCAVAAKLSKSEVNALATEAATHRDYLYKFAMKKVGDADLADDLVQDTLLAALQSVDSKSAFAGRSLFRGWLTGILKHKIMDAYRDRYRFVSLTMEGDDGEQKEHGEYAAHGEVPKVYGTSIAPQPRVRAFRTPRCGRVL